MAPARDYDVAVIGGGLVGAAIGWGLARLGERVAVLDEGDVAYRASRGNFALVWVQSKGLGLAPYAAWTKRSSDGWAGFAEILRGETGLDVAFQRPGGLHLCLSDAELSARQNYFMRLHNQPDMVPYPYEMLDHRATAALIPEIGPEVAGASYCPLDGHCNSLRLLRALHFGLQRHGATYLANHMVDTIMPQAGGGFALQTAGGTVHAAKVVLAAGNGNPRLAPMVGLDAPIRPQRGQIVATERVAPFLHHPITTIRQTDEGSILMGDSVEEAGFDDTVGLGVVSTIAERAVRMLPLLARVNVVRTWAALRVMTRDGFPIYDQSADHPGAFVATCHSGVTLAANHALVLPEMLKAGDLAPVLAPFSAKRFDVPAAA
ncbi:MAG TPA: FAD-dependent oxidoreductase [Candidatus Sulfotelmatobacter sp.]|nr:FAD-dependent oxidoreductase [Candidatus Sulfotelmatobacter sp.]